MATSHHLAGGTETRRPKIRQDPHQTERSHSQEGKQTTKKDETEKPTRFHKELVDKPTAAVTSRDTGDELGRSDLGLDGLITDDVSRLTSLCLPSQRCLHGLCMSRSHQGPKPIYCQNKGPTPIPDSKASSCWASYRLQLHNRKSYISSEFFSLFKLRLVSKKFWPKFFASSFKHIHGVLNLGKQQN